MRNHDTEPRWLNERQFNVDPLGGQVQRVENFRNEDCKRSFVAPEEGAVVVREVEVADQKCCQAKKFPKIRQSPMLVWKKTLIAAEQRLLQVIEHSLAVATKDVEK